MYHNLDAQKPQTRKDQARLDQPVAKFEPPTGRIDRLKWMFFSFEGSLNRASYSDAFWTLIGIAICFVVLAFLTPYAPFLGVLFVLVLPLALACIAIGLKRAQDTGLNSILFLLLFILGFGVFTLIGMIALLFIEKDQFA